MTIILEEDNIKELIAKEYKVDVKNIRFIHGLGFVSAIIDEVEDDNVD